MLQKPKMSLGRKWFWQQKENEGVDGREKDRRGRGEENTYLVSWFMIDVLGSPWRGSHGCLGPVLSPELGLQVFPWCRFLRRDRQVALSILSNSQKSPVKRTPARALPVAGTCAHLTHEVPSTSWAD